MNTVKNNKKGRHKTEKKTGNSTYVRSEGNPQVDVCSSQGTTDIMGRQEGERFLTQTECQDLRVYLQEMNKM